MIREELKEYFRRTGATQIEVAKKIGTSSALLSQYLKNSYKGDVSKLEKTLQEFLRREKERSLTIREHRWVETKQSKEVLAVLNYAHLYKTIGVVYGSAGLGKTESIRQYMRENTQVINVICSPVLNNAAILEEILEKLGKVASGGKRKMFKAVVEALEGSDMMIVFDEAQHLNYKSIETIRAIHDMTGVAIVMVGTVEVYDRMTGRRNLKYDQVFSRVGIKRYLKPKILKRDIEALVKENFSNVDEGAIEFLYRRAQEAGAIRKIVMMLRMADSIAKNNGQIINLKNLEEAEKLLWGRYI